MAPIDKTIAPAPGRGPGTAAIAELDTQFDIFRFLKQVTVDYGLLGFMVTNIPSRTSPEIGSNSVITNWPAELLILYDQEKLVETSPVMARMWNSVAPVTFDVSLEAGKTTSVKRQKTVELLERFRMPRGACFPVHDASGARGALLFAGDRPVLDPGEMMELSYLSIHIFDRMAEIRRGDQSNSASLTDREVDCLVWTSAGKTSAEIAEILGLSEHTVNHYLNRATRKLDAVNRTQAVAKALRTGIIK